MNRDFKIIVCPNDVKIRLLEEYDNSNSLHNIKFMNKDEFIKNYFFDYDYNTIYYLMNKYNYNLDVCRVYLKNMLVIDTNKDYKNDKLNFLKNLKLELINNNLLKFNLFFREYIKNKNIEVINYYDLDKYEEEALDHKVNFPESNLSTCVYEFDSISEEVNFVCLEIIKLIENDIPLNKIFLCNVSEEYYYILDKMFSYYNIPINIDFKDSIYSNIIVQNYLKNRELDLDNKNNNIINRKLVSILSDLSIIDSNSEIYDKFLIDKLKNTYFSPKKYDNAINIKDLFKSNFKDDEYVFVLGFNQDCLPKMYKDIEFITDNDKDEISMYSVSYLNKRSRESIIYLLSKIKNLTLSYKLSTPFQSFYKSSLINDLGLDIVRVKTDNYNYSNIYNKLKLSEMLDMYNLYGEKDSSLELLYSNYNIPYKSYSNKYISIDNKKYLDSIKSLRLSYTSLNSYNECCFKYYIKYVLKLDSNEDTFSSFIGSMYHDILSLYKNTNFNFDDEWNKYLENRDLSLKEKVLLVKLKKDLLLLIDVLKKQELITGFNDEIHEKKFEVKLALDIPTTFVGYIDKIMYYNNYFSIIDYKSGLIDTHIEPLKYGLHMQLPTYLYLIKHSNIFNNPIFTGIYYQNILFNYPTWSSNVEKELNDRYKLKGYSTTSIDALARFDSTYEDSSYIKSMKYDSSKGFSRFSKVMDNDTVNSLVDYTEKIIYKKSNDIINSKFDINPKVYDKNNISCEFCAFKDLCFMNNGDLTYLDKVDDLSFLGGEE